MKRFLLILFSICFMASSAQAWDGPWDVDPVPYVKKTAAPTVNDDSFIVPYLWVDETNDKFYLLIDNTSGAAVWQEVIYSGGSPTFTDVTATGNIQASTYGSGANPIPDATLLGIDDGTTDQIMVGGGANLPGVWTTATGTGAPVRANSPTIAGLALVPTTLTATGPTDDLDVSSVNVIKVDTSSNNVTLGGLTGGVDGQQITIVIVDATNNTTVENAESTGNQDIYLESAGDETKTATYGGWILECDGSNWYQTGGGGGASVWTETGDSVAYDGNVGIGTVGLPAGKLHTVLTPSAPALFGGNTVETITDASSAGTAVITKAGDDFSGTCAVGDALIITDATTAADEGVYRIVTVGTTTLTVDRALAGSDADVDFYVVKDTILMTGTDGTNGNRIMGYSAQDKPLQIGGDTLAATGHSLGAEDVLVGGKAEFNEEASFDSHVYLNKTTRLMFFDGYFGQIRGSGDDGLIIGVGTNAWGNRNIIITDSAHVAIDHDHEDLSTNPTQFIHSALSPNVSNNQWGSFSHDQENFVITTGANVGTGTGATTNNNGVSIAPSTLTADAAGQYGMKVTRTLNDASASGSGTFSLIEGDITATAAGGWGTVNLMDLKYGGVSKFIVDNSGNVTIAGFNIHSMTTGITAVSPGVQGDGALTTSYNHITTVGTADDAVTLTAAVAGIEINVRNDGANQLEIWPASGDDCGNGVDTACTLAAGAAVTYVAIDATTWKIW